MFPESPKFPMELQPTFLHLSSSRCMDDSSQRVAALDGLRGSSKPVYPQVADGRRGSVHDGSPSLIGVKKLRSVDVFRKQTAIVLHSSRRRRRPTMTVWIVVPLVLALANALILLVYIAQLRSRKLGQRALLARDLGISALALKDRKVVGFFHPFW